MDGVYQPMQMPLPYPIEWRRSKEYPGIIGYCPGNYNIKSRPMAPADYGLVRANKKR